MIACQCIRDRMKVDEYMKYEALKKSFPLILRIGTEGLCWYWEIFLHIAQNISYAYTVNFLSQGCRLFMRLYGNLSTVLQKKIVSLTLVEELII